MLNYVRQKFHPLWRLRKMAWFRYLQGQIDFPVSTKSGFIRYFVMLLRDFSLIANSKETEIETHKVFEKILLNFPITHILDIGTNVGVFAWHAYNINPDLNLFLFEPDSTNIRLLKKTIKYNNLNKVILWEGVVSNKVGKTEFLVDKVSGSTGSLKDDSTNLSSLHYAYKLSNKIVVNSTSVDEYMEAIFINKIASIIKIDVEGAELEVILGAQSFINKFRPFIIVESFNYKSLEPLIEADYITYPLAENCNYLLIPKEVQHQFIKKEIVRNDSKLVNTLFSE